MIKEAVKVETREQNEYVKNKINNPARFIDFKRYEITKDICININNGLYSNVDYYIRNGYKIISFNEFKSRYELKIGDTFNYNGFVCRVESEVEKWYYNPGSKAFFKSSYNKPLDCEEITNKEFIKQLEENAR